MSVLGKWTHKGLPRPHWSNASGNVSFQQLGAEFLLTSEAAWWDIFE